MIKKINIVTEGFKIIILNNKFLLYLKNGINVNNLIYIKKIYT